MAVVSGGTTLIDNGALDAGVPTGNLILLETQTASASASISFTSNIDSTYDSYVFKFINIHPSGGNQTFHFQASTNGGSSYGVTITSTVFIATHDEADTITSFGYRTAHDLAQSTSFQRIMRITNDNDNNGCGTLQIFNPSSTTFVKHFIANCQETNSNTYTHNQFTAGYFNTTSSLNAFQFKFDSGNIDDGIIKMYGVK